MNAIRRFAMPALLVLASSVHAAPADEAVAACEQAARRTLSSTRGSAADVTFNAPAAVLPGAGDATERVLRGAGRVRRDGASRGFTYSCSVDARTGDVAGVVVRDTVAASERAAVARTPVEPDLSQISPAACETAAASALQRRWPKVARISFDAQTRALQQDSLGNADLRGQGTAQPVPGAPSTHFSYRCAIDARNGRVLATRIDG
jgi:hypothetical protein